MASQALTTRRTLFAVPALLPALPVLAHASPPVSRWQDWLDGYGIVAQNPEVMAIMMEAHHQGFRAEQVHAITFGELSRLPSIQLKDNGDQVEIWRNCTLRCHGERGAI